MSKKFLKLIKSMNINFIYPKLTKMKITSVGVVVKLMEVNIKSKYKAASRAGGRGRATHGAAPRAGARYTRGLLQGQGACAHKAAPRAGRVLSMGQGRGRTEHRQRQVQGTCCTQGSSKSRGDLCEDN